MSFVRKTLFATLLTGLVAGTTPILTQAQAQALVGATAPTEAQVRELEQQLQSLQQQVDQINATRDTAARRRLMQENWQGMQEYMAQMHDRWGMGYPWMMGPGTTGCPMFGSDGAGWPTPRGLTPDRYAQQMRDYTRRMQEQMNKIAQTTDPQERQRLMQQHWEGAYQDMQTMRGMGWMWGGGGMMGPGMMQGGMMRGTPAPSAKPLPDADSTGAKLVSNYCAQCHAAPAPTLHSAKEWANVTRRMHIRMDNGWQGIKTPTEQEMKTIVAYMEKYARR